MKTTRSILVVLSSVWLSCCVIAEEIKKNGSNVEEKFFEAAQNDKVEEMKTMLSKRTDLISIKNADGRSPLHIAALHGSREAAKLLVAAKADINAATKEGETPLFCAAANGDREIVSLLLANKASVNVMDGRYSTPLRVALADMKKKEIADLLVQHGAREENKFYQLAAKNSLVVEVSEGFKEVPVMEGWSDRYGYAISNAELGCEIRMQIDPVDTSTPKPGETRADMNRIYLTMLFTLMQNITGEKPENIYTLGSENALKLYNADDVGVAFSEIKSNVNKDPKSFARGFGHCLATAIHRDNVADAYIIYLYKNKAAYEKALKNQAWMENGFKFQEKSDAEDKHPPSTLPKPDRKASPNRVVSERLITRLNPSWRHEFLTISEDNRRLACVGEEGKTQFVVVDGIEGKRYEYIGENTLMFSPDGKRVAYVAPSGEQFMVVVDGQEGKSYDGLNTILFSPDGKRIAYAAKNGKKWRVVVDGKEGNLCDSLGKDMLTFSPDGVRLAYTAMTNGRWRVVLDEVPGNPYDGISEGGLVFSPDGKGLTYQAKTKDGWVTVLNGREGRPYGSFGALAISPDGKSAAAVVLQGNKQFVVQDDKAEKAYEGIMHDSLIFSPDSKRLGYIAHAAGKRFAVVNGREDKPFDRIADDKLVFSPDSARVAYAAKSDDKWCMVVSGKPGKFYDGIVDDRPIFSPDGQRIAYVAREDDKWMLVVDGKEEKPYDGVFYPVFSQDSQRIAYYAQDGENSFVVFDGTEGKSYDGFFKKTKPRFDSATALHYLAIKGEDVYLVEDKIDR